MKSKLIGFIGIVGLIFLFLAIFPSTLFAGEYSQTYKFEQPTITTLSNGLQIVELKHAFQNDAAIGAPLLPVRTVKIFVPIEEKAISISVKPGILKAIDGTYTIQHATRPYPTSYTGPIKLDKPDAAIYSSDADYPSVVHIERGSQYLCGTQIVLVDLSPIAYNPVRGQLKYYEQIEVKVLTEWQGRPAGVMPSRNRPEDRKQILRTIDNKDDFLLQMPAVQGQKSKNIEESSALQDNPLALRDYVVITTAGMVAAFQALTNHRQSAAGGSFTTYIETISNIKNNYSGVDDAEKMRNFIKDMYTNYGTKYVVLGGDCDGVHGSQTISTRGCYALVNGGSPPDQDPDYYIPCDLYFGCLDGTWNNDGDSLWGESNDGVGGADIDWYSEVYVGRIPADNATEATAQINKIIAYETGSPPYKTLLVGEQLDATPTWGGDRMDWVHGYMNYMPNTKLYDKNGTWAKSNLLSHINSDTHNWLNHMGHGNPNWNMKLANNDVASMTNSQYFFHYTQACYSGSIDGRGWGPGATYISGDCILGDMVNSNNHGAFAVIGNSRFGWYYDGSYVQGASNQAHKKFVEAIFTGGYKRLGEANQRSKTDLNLTSGLYRWIAFETNLLGCPATEMETGGGGDAGEVIQTWTPANNTEPWGIAYTCDNTVWVGDGWGANATHEYQTNGTVTGNSWSYTWSPSYGPADSAFNWNTGMVWSMDVGGDNCIHEMDPAGGYTGNTICGPWSVSQRGLAYDPDTDTWFVGGWNEDTIYHINSSGTLLDSSNVGLNIAGLAYNPDTQHLFVIENAAPNDIIYVLDASDNYNQMSQFNIGGSFSDYGGAGLEIDCDGNLWAVERVTNTVFQIKSGEETSVCDRGGNPMVAYGNGIAIDFGALGLWYYDGADWSRISTADAEWLGIYMDKLVADFGATHGLWQYDGTSWQQINTLDADNTGNTMAAFNNCLAVDFGSKTLYYFNGAAWSQMSTNNTEWLGTYMDKLVADFGAAYGLWQYNSASWTMISTADVDN